MKAHKSERASAIWPRPGPGRSLIIAVDVRLEQRLNIRLQVKPVIELVVNFEIPQPVQNRMPRRGAFQLRSEHLIFPLFAAARAAEQIELAVDIFRVLRADAPVQRHDCSAARRQPLERRVTRRINLHPLCALRHKHGDAVHLVDQLRPIRPRLIRVQHGRLNFGLRLEQLGQHACAGHKLVRRRWMPIRTLTDNQQALGLRLDSENTRIEVERQQHD